MKFIFQVIECHWGQSSKNVHRDRLVIIQKILHLNSNLSLQKMTIKSTFKFKWTYPQVQIWQMHFSWAVGGSINDPAPFFFCHALFCLFRQQERRSNAYFGMSSTKFNSSNLRTQFFFFLLSCGPRIVLPRSITDFQSMLRWHAYAKQFAHDDFLGDVWTATAGIVWTPAKQLDWTHLTTEPPDLYRSAIDSVAVTVSWALTIQPDVCRTCPVRIMRPNPPHPPSHCVSIDNKRNKIIKEKKNVVRL